MNKKILTLFLVVAASAILAVSCNNKTTDQVKNNGGSTGTGSGTEETKKEIALTQVQDAIKLLGEVKAGSNGDKGVVDFKNVTLKQDATVAVDAKKGSDSLSSGALKTAIEEAGKKVVLDNTEKIEFTTDKITGTGKTVSFTIKFTAKEGYSFSGFDNGKVQGQTLTVTVTLTGKDTDGSAENQFAN